MQEILQLLCKGSYKDLALCGYIRRMGNDMTQQNGNETLTILLVEDDTRVRESVRRVLEFERYTVITATDGAEGLEALAKVLPDLVIMDVMMPNVDGLTACRLIREQYKALPILLLTARHEVSDRVAGLDAGADDYLVKPFALDELLARVRALLRRTSATDSSDVLRVGDLELDPLRRKVRRGSEEIELTKTEFDLLELMMVNAGIVLDRDLIYDRIWGYDFETGSRSLDVYIGYLRKKTEENGMSRVVHTVRGVGYVVKP